MTRMSGNGSIGSAGTRSASVAWPAWACDPGRWGRGWCRLSVKPVQVGSLIRYQLLPVLPLAASGCSWSTRGCTARVVVRGCLGGQGDLEVPAGPILAEQHARLLRGHGQLEAGLLPLVLEDLGRQLPALVAGRRLELERRLWPPLAQMPSEPLAQPSPVISVVTMSGPAGICRTARCTPCRRPGCRSC